MVVREYPCGVVTADRVEKRSEDGKGMSVLAGGEMRNPSVHIAASYRSWYALGKPQALFLPVSKKLRAQKTQKISASKKLKGHFEKKLSVVEST